MSLEPREDNDKMTRPERTRSFETAAAERNRAMGRAVMTARLREAEYKNSISMELNVLEEFMIKNKAFFKKELGRKRK